MLEALSDKLSGVFQKLGSHGSITEKDLDQAMREVRTRYDLKDSHSNIELNETLKLPEGSDASQARASYEDGRLVVRIPKSALKTAKPAS